MILLKRIYLINAFFLFSVEWGQSSSLMPQIQQDTTKINPTISSRLPINGIRIAWDFNTLRKVSSSANNERYCGYARMIQRIDKSLIAVYEADGNVVVVKSTDRGNTWSEPIVVANKHDGVNMAVPDILELKDASILVCYNPRPSGKEPTKRFAIRTKKSYDGGLIWKDEQLLYEADYRFENGCWEPSAIQLPNREIQLFFANEGIYTTSGEQNISMLRSNDNGLTWTQKPQIVSFRAGSRDGMPVPILLNNHKEIAFSIEDNGFDNFKPYVIKNTLTQNWDTVVDAKSDNRFYALSEKIRNDIYAGAPYLRQLKTGETILSYQGTEGRNNKMDFSEMKVVIGNDQAYNFSRKSSPFSIPNNKSGLWNSLSVLDDNSVVALTSTNAYANRSEIWMIKGYVIPALKVNKETLVIDGLTQENIWKSDLPILIGQKSATQARASVSYDEKNLYIVVKVNDTKVVSNVATLENNDGISIFIDAQNKAYEAPDKGVYRFFMATNNQLSMKEGAEGKWIDKANMSGIKSAVKTVTGGYVQEIAISWNSLGGKPPKGKRIGFNVSLTENSGKNIADYTETIAGNIENAPYTWSGIFLK